MTAPFRDAGFAALERVRVLEGENAALRRELATHAGEDVAALRAELERTRNALHNSKVSVKKPTPRERERERKKEPLPLVLLTVAAVVFFVMLASVGHPRPARSQRSSSRSSVTARQASIGPISSPDRTKNASP